MRHRVVLVMVVAALSLALIPVAAPAGTVSAGTDEVIAALVLDEAEANALGLEFVSLDNASSSGYGVTAKYTDHSFSEYDINFTLTLSLLETSYDAEEITVENMSYDCDACVDPDCNQFRCDETGDLYDFARPCYSPFRNGYTDFGGLSGETAFAQGDLLVKIESKTLYGITTPEYYERSKSRHEWFVGQVVTKITAGYLADMMQLTARAFIATQPTGTDVYMSGQDVVVMEGTVTGPNGGVADAVLEGFYLSEAGSGWNYQAATDSSGNFRRVMGGADEVARISVRVRHTDTSPAYAGTFRIIIDVGGPTGVVDTGMSVGVSTDKTVYSAGEMIVISGSVADSKGGLADATVVVDVNGSPVAATLDSSGKYQFAHGLAVDIADGLYTITATASHADYPDAINSTTFVVGDMAVLVEQNPVTGEPFVGVAADGVSTLKMGISLPGCTDVSVSTPDIGELKGDSISEAGTIKLDSAGQAEFTYHPPDYLTKDQLGASVDVHQTGSKTWFAEVPLVFTYKDADGQEGRLEGMITVCRPPVMLVHGFVGSTATWGKMSTYLRGERFDTFPGDYLLQDLSIEQLSGVLQTDISQQKLDYANSNIKLTKVDVVGHSMGGLISRYYANGLPGYAGDLRKLIMVGTPNHGVSWLRMKAGNAASKWYDTHSIPGEQLYSESAFMKALNAGEKAGAHLNVDVQYGNIYGMPDDWVVSAASAHLNGVKAVLQSDVKHSPDIPGVPKVAITENLATWEQVNDWLLDDIFRPPLKGSHAEVYKYLYNVYIDADISRSSTTKLSFEPTDLEPFQVLRTGEKSTATVHLTIEDIPWGIIHLDPETEILLGYYSPQLVEVRLLKGSAAFKSKKDGHFSVPVNIGRSTAGEWWKTTPQAVVTGLDTEFVVSAGPEVVVHCLDGNLVVDTPEATDDGHVVGEGESVAVNGETVAAADSVSEGDFWWSEEDDDFLDEPWGGSFLDRVKGLMDSLVSWIKSLF
ncbi:MAG: hypothetical protein IMY84_00280 [Chloroflexi bacterium]|nr:hypothetical protein [Chloroflexota bacterium]